MNMSHAPNNPMPSSVERTPEPAAPVGALALGTGSVVWLKMETNHWLKNLAWSTPTVALCVAFSVEYTEIRFPAGLMLGLWLGMLHNIWWAWLTRRASSQNNSGQTAATNAAK